MSHSSENAFICPYHGWVYGLDGQRVVEDGAIAGTESLVALAADLQPVV